MITTRANLWAIDPKGTIKDSAPCVDWEIRRDYLALDKSTFTPARSLDIEPQDWLLVKYESSDIPSFFGRVDSLSNGAVVCQDYWGVLASIEVPVNLASTPTSAPVVLGAMLQSATGGALAAPSVPVGLPHVPWDWTPDQTSDTPPVVRMSDLAAYYFRRYGLVIMDGAVSMTNYSVVSQDRYWSRMTDLKQVTVRDNAVSFLEWDTYEQPQNENAANELRIVNKTSPFLDIAYPNLVYPPVYLATDNSLTMDKAQGVRVPTRVKWAFFDPATQIVTEHARKAEQGLTGLDFSMSAAAAPASLTVGGDPVAIQKPSTVVGNIRIHDLSTLVELKQDVLYKMTASVRRPNATPISVAHIGVSGRRQVGTEWQWVNASGANSADAQHYFAASDVTPNAGDIVTYTGYFKWSPTHAVSNVVSPDPTNPGWMHPTATHVVPLVIGSYYSIADAFDVFGWSITESRSVAPLEIAASELLGNVYAHEISFGVRRESTLLTPDDLRVGTPYTIVRGDTVYRSVLTGYSMTSASDIITLRFGFIKSRLGGMI